MATSAGELEAERVVLTAGAYSSPGILLRSGIGPERGLPVGEELCDHVGVGFGFEPTDAFRDEIRRFEEERPVLANEHDAETLTEAVDAFRTLAASDPIRRYAAREIRPGLDVDAATHVRTGARGFFHPTGTCALGRVVDTDGRVLGFENLHVADASFIPSIPRVPVNLTVAAVAEKLAASLAAT